MQTDQKGSRTKPRLSLCGRRTKRGNMSPELTTLCYIEKDDSYLMLHRVSRKKDINKDKWIGVGGHFEDREAPEECLLREVLEETGLTLTSFKLRAIITFLSGKDICEYMHLFTADGFEGQMISCDEGHLEWVKKSEVTKLNLWPGDRIFLKLLEERQEMFLLKLTYDDSGQLIEAKLDGQILELKESLFS